MKTKSLVAAAMLAGALAGCGSASTPTVGGTSASSPASAQDLLVTSVPTAGGAKYRFVIKGGDTPLSGVLDAAGKAYRYDVTQVNTDPHFTMTMNFLFVGGKSWVKIAFSDTAGLTGLPKLPKKWMLLDKAKLKGDDALPTPADDESDPGSAGAIMDGIVAAQQTTPGHFTGTTDLTKQPDAGIVEAKTLTALGAKAKNLAFRADTDASGRLTSVIVKIPAVGKTTAHEYAVSYRDYGTATTPVQPAAAEQQPAPAAAYEMLNG